MKKALVMLAGENLLFDRPHPGIAVGAPEALKTEYKNMSDEEKLSAKLYRTKKGEIYIPIHYVKLSFDAAGRFLAVKDYMSKSSFNAREKYMKYFKSCVTLSPAELIITPQKHEQFDNVGRNDKGAPIYQSRILIPRWEVNMTVDYDENYVSEKALIDGLNTAGKYVRIGAWRQRFGTFKIKGFKKLK